ncbi:ABC transporter [Phytophthora cinnamomi]|uniref:ABC transporter n=1 Tax=Phytophthora cinnamomi TaxID=4785 RepID=UPI00355A47FB|nr:ABC transporter [Phytophthora cinnamomi]
MRGFFTLAVVSLLGVTKSQNQATTLPSVRIRTTANRKSTLTHGQSEFDTFAIPVLSTDKTKVLYDAYATFVQNGIESTYSLVDGAWYLDIKDPSSYSTAQQSARCLSSGPVPVNSIMQSLNDATPIPSASIGDKKIECTDGKLLQTSFGGADYALCVSGTSGFTAHSSDLTIVVEYLNTPVKMPTLTLSENAKSCPKVEKAAPVAPAAANARSLKEASHMAMAASTCSCKSKPRPCIFFHGSGQKHEEAQLQDTPKLLSGKLGSISGHAPCCSSIKYAVLNTEDYGWTNDSLQQKYCTHSLSLSKTSNVSSKTIDDTIVVTHSMAGLVMAGALTTGKCKFGPGTSWVALSPPMTGSMASDYLQNFCTGKFSGMATELLDLLGECPTSKARLSTFYQNDKLSSPALNAAYAAAQKTFVGNVSAAMCSDAYVGLYSEYQAVSILAGKIIPHKSSKNDGLVEFQSCQGGLDTAKFGTSYTNTFYKPTLNHADTAFLNGDGHFGDARKPVKWFECLL